MSRFPALARTFRVLVLAALPLGLTACCGDPEDYVRESVIDPEAPANKTLVDACLADDLSCTELCREVLRAEGEARADEAAFSECRIMNDAATDLHMTYSFPYECIGGRKPAGLRGCVPARAASPAGVWLARMAQLEAASVYAFANTARQLARLGAPRELVARAVVAIREEIEHARIVAGLARRWGVEPPPVYMAAPRDQSLFELCLDNAIEGCVRETYGAAIATYQAFAATDPEVREAMARIAADETAHAETSFAIDRWARPRLGATELDRIDAARRGAIGELAAAAEALPAEAAAMLGLPGRAEKQSILAGLRDRVWT